MRRLMTLALPSALAVLLFAASERPVVSRAALVAVEKNIDKRLETEVLGGPFLLLGMTRGFYLPGYGVVLTAEVNLAHGANPSPFRSKIPKEEIASVYIKKRDKYPVLKKEMQDLLISSGASLDTVPPDEQVVLGVMLFFHAWENTTGLPQQVVMMADRKTLVEFQTGRRERSTAGSVIRVQESF